MSDNKTNTPAVSSEPTQEEKNITNSVLNKVVNFEKSGEIKIPQDYSVANALKSAWLILQETKDRNNNPVLQSCTKESIANSLLKMVVWGLSPLKKQGDFIAYGQSLDFSPEYTGNLVLAKRYGGLVNYTAKAIFKGDEFEFETDLESPYRTKITKHKRSLESMGGEVIGAYFAFELKSGAKDVEIMNMIQIRNAWNQGQMKGNSGAHKNFTDQMAIKTVINRGCKLLIRGSDDSVLYTSEDEQIIYDPIQEDLNAKVESNANKKQISFENPKGDSVKIDRQEPLKEKPEESAIKPNENPTILF